MPQTGLALTSTDSNLFRHGESSLAEEIRQHGPGAAQIASFQELILSHYAQHGRSFPWREISDPYLVLVSEIMLQQTQTSRVEKVFPTFSAIFPGLEALAEAPLERVLAAWRGLGYNRRARSLHRCAQIIASKHGGRLPPDPAVLATLPGIGRATAASICAFAFDMPVVFIETNIRAVFIHFFFPDTEGVSDREIEPLVSRSLYLPAPRRWYNALMDYGSSLKKRVPDPSRKSAGYRPQKPFEGSNRQARGKILTCLVQQSPITRETIAVCTGIAPERLSPALDELEKEGFIVKEEQDLYRIR